MSTPIVTETPLRSEPVARDTFVDDVARVTDPPPRRSPGSSG